MRLQAAGDQMAAPLWDGPVEVVQQGRVQSSAFYRLLLEEGAPAAAANTAVGITLSPPPRCLLGLVRACTPDEKSSALTGCAGWRTGGR